MPRSDPVSTVLVPEQLRVEMTRRGWDAIDLAKAARLSPATGRFTLEIVADEIQFLSPEPSLRAAV